MAKLQVYLFQTLRVITDDGRLLDLGSPTTRSLFGYLLLNRSHPLDRRRLAFIFWPRGSETAARRNLRQYLHRVRRVLEQVDTAGDWLFTDGNEVQFNPMEDLWLDVEAFRQAARPDATLAELQLAASLYTGDLLEDVYDDWCQEERQQLRNVYANLLERLSQRLQEAGRLDAAVQYAQKWTRAEPLDEAAHRRLLMLYALNGDRNRAIRHYQSMTETLQSELATDPLPETHELFLEIQAGNLEQVESYASTNGRTHVQSAEKVSAAPPSPKPRHTKTKIAPSIPIVGRAGELKTLHDLLQGAGAGSGRFVLVTGESGIGKTRLVQEYLERYCNSPTLHNTCHELESVLPYAALKPVLRQAVEQVIQPVDARAPSWLDGIVQLLPDVATSPVHAALISANTNGSSPVEEAVIDLLLTLSRQSASQPLQLVLDDLHWADTPTWNMLARLARLAPAERLLVFGLCRMEDLSGEKRRFIRTLERNELLVHIPLKRLTAEETASLAAHLMPGSPLDTFFLHRLYQETEGNPFFIIAIAHALRETTNSSTSQQPSSRSSGASSLMPLSIQRVIEARLDRLSPASQELLATAAALGRAFTLSLLEEISQQPVEDIIQYIEEWVRRGLVWEEPGGYDFSHDKIRQVSYASLSRARRQYVHRRIASILESAIAPIEDATLAHHYARSDQPLKALPYLTRAGEQALQTRAYLEARSFGQQAVSLLGQLPGPRQRSERIDLNMQLAQAYAFTGDLRRAQEILAETESLALALGDESRLGVLFHRSAQIFWLRGQPGVAGDYARRLLRTAEERSDPRLLQAALRMLGRVGIALSAFDDAIAYFVRYTNLEGSPPAPDLPIVLGYLGIAYSRVGSWGRALEAARRGVNLAESALEGSRSQGIAFARMQLGFVYAGAYDWQNCLETIRDTPDPLDRSQAAVWSTEDQDGEPGLTPLGFMLLGLRGLVMAHLGKPVDGAQIIRPALAWAEQSDYRVFHYLPRIFLTEALLLAGKVNEAQVEAELSLEQARAAGNRWAVGISLRQLGEILTRKPSPDWSRIENCLIESMHLLRQVRARPDLARTYLALRKLYDRAGQIAWAVDCHFRATSIFEELGMAEELRQAQGQAARNRQGARVIPGLGLRGPNVKQEPSPDQIQ